MNRRGFLAAMLGAAAAPAIVRAESLMKIVVPKQEIIVLDYVKLLEAIAPEWNELAMQRFNERIARNARWGAHVGDMDISSMYLHSTPVFVDKYRHPYATAMPLISDKHMGIIR
jgi:hypothetical protein